MKLKFHEQMKQKIIKGLINYKDNLSFLKWSATSSLWSSVTSVGVHPRIQDIMTQNS